MGGGIGGEIEGERKVGGREFVKKGVWDHKWAWRPKIFQRAYFQPPHLQNEVGCSF